MIIVTVQNEVCALFALKLIKFLSVFILLTMVFNIWLFLMDSSSCEITTSLVK